MEEGAQAAVAHVGRITTIVMPKFSGMYLIGFLILLPPCSIFTLEQNVDKFHARKVSIVKVHIIHSCEVMSPQENYVHKRRLPIAPTPSSHVGGNR